MTVKPYISIGKSGKARLVNKRTMPALRGKQKPKGLDRGARDVVNCGVEAVKVESKMTAKEENKMTKSRDEIVHENLYEYDEGKCPSCNWEVGGLYILAQTQEEADDLRNKGYGICGDCMSALIVEMHGQVSTDPAYVEK